MGLATPTLENMGIESASLELCIRVLCDENPKNSVDGTYLYCQTEDNQQALFQAASSLVQSALTARILVLQTDALCGFPGFPQWKKSLLNEGLNVEHIEGIQVDTLTILHTLIESRALIRFARQRGYTSLRVVASPFQQLRAFMTAVTVALKEYPELLLYSYSAPAMPWREEVMHSQGTLRATRSALIATELERIERYQKKGDLASFKDVLAYLDKREIMA